MPAPRGEAEQARFVAVEPEPSTDGVNPVARFSFSLPASMPAEALMLLQGTLSDYHERRVVSGDLPGTLLARQIEANHWWARDAQSDAGVPRTVTAVAASLLSPNETYTWVAVGVGSLLSFQVQGDTPKLLRRYWPPDEVGFSGYAAYCAEAPLATDNDHAQFEPDTAVALSSGLGLVNDQRCVSFEIESPWPSWLLPPLELAGLLVEPAPLEARPASPGASPSCASGWQAMGPGCVVVEDDRLRVQPPAGASLWQLQLASLEAHQLVSDGAPFVLRGLTPGHVEELSYDVVLTDGSRHRGRARVQTSAARARVVINEVLANPIGSEPAQEWVELHNEGLLSVDLAGWRFADSGGEVALPSVRIDPGQFLLLVSETYAEAGEDIAFPAGTSVVRLPALAASGIGNVGEALSLIDPNGVIASHFPAISASRAGFSVARRTPDASDDDANAFAIHAAPGASPGAANELGE